MLDGKLVLVTGASRGIGKAIALTLGRDGATVIGTATTESGADNVSKVFAENEISGKGVIPMLLTMNKLLILLRVSEKILVQSISWLIMLVLPEIISFLE